MENSQSHWLVSEPQQGKKCPLKHRHGMEWCVCAHHLWKTNEKEEWKRKEETRLRNVRYFNTLLLFLSSFFFFLLCKQTELTKSDYILCPTGQHLNKPRVFSCFFFFFGFFSNCTDILIGLGNLPEMAAGEKGVKCALNRWRHDSCSALVSAPRP